MVNNYIIDELCMILLHGWGRGIVKDSERKGDERRRGELLKGKKKAQSFQIIGEVVEKMIASLLT